MCLKTLSLSLVLEAKRLGMSNQPPSNNFLQDPKPSSTTAALAISSLTSSVESSCFLPFTEEQLTWNTSRSWSMLFSFSLLASCPNLIKLRPRDNKLPWGNFQTIRLLHITSQAKEPALPKHPARRERLPRGQLRKLCHVLQLDLGLL